MRAAAFLSTLALAAALAGCSARRGAQPAPEAATRTEPAPAVSEELLDDLTMLALGRRLAPEERRQHLARLTSGEVTLEQYVRSLVEAPEFSEVVAPRVLLGYLATAPFSFEVMPLQYKEIDGVRVHFRKEACKPSETEEVSPWWDMSTTIRVCRHDYRPNILKDSKGYYCTGGTGGFVRKECGCGPNLIFCSASAEHTDQIVWSLLQESLKTIAYIVSHDMPLSEVFTTRYSFRDRNAAWTYLRDEIVNGKRDRMPDLASWPAEGAWAPRPEIWHGQHAGIMTNLHLAYMSDGPRDRMRFYYERAWCMAPTSFGVDIDQFRTLVHGAADLRYHQARWKQLAAAPGCTTCHARLDYGMQFFLGYQDFMSSMGATAATQRAGTGPIFGDDISDPRGEGPLTPHGFAELLVSQPEFERCMVEHVNRHVFAGAAEPRELGELRRAFRASGSMKDLVARALVLYVRRRAAGEPAPGGEAAPSGEPAAPSPTPAAASSAAAAPAAGPAAAERSVPLPPNLVDLLDRHCSHCHAEGRLGFLGELDRRPALDRARVLSMLTFTAFEVMPKGPNRLSSAERRLMVLEMIRALGFTGEAQMNARAYFLGAGFRGSPVHFVDASRDAVAQAAGTRRTEPWPWVVEDEIEGSLQTVTPGFIMQIAQTAAQACRAAGDPAARQACLERALDPDLFLAR